MGCCGRRLIENVSSQIQPPDTENRMSGGVGGITDAISLSRPDQQKPRWSLHSLGQAEYQLSITEITMENIQFWHWLILGVIFLAIEVFAPTTLFLWFGVSALITGLVAWLIPGLPIGAEILIFAVSALVSIAAFRVLIKHAPVPESPDPELNNRLSSFIGREYKLTQPIESGRGRLKLGDSMWGILGDDLPTGSKIRITGVKGIQFLVEAI